MLRSKPIDDRAKLFKIYRRINRTIVNLQLVGERLKQQVTVHQVRVGKNERRRGWRVFVEIMQPVNRITQSKRLVRA